jgi:DNA invertase Pin-like site-specific DNA recombinase
MPRKGSLSRRNRTVANDNKDTRVFLYTRVSTDKQENSLKAQKAIADSFTTPRGILIDETVTDDDSSAVKVNFLDRPKVKEMLAVMRRRNIRTILVLRPDRFARSSFDYNISLKWLSENGYNLRFIEPDLDLDTPIGKVILTILVSIAEMECGMKTVRVDNVLDDQRTRRVARGNNPSYGWKLTDEIVEYSKISKGTIPLYRVAPIQHEQTILRHIIQLWDAREKKHGLLTAIAADLNERGIPTKMAGMEMTKNGRTITCSGEWHPATVKSVIEHAVIATREELENSTQTLAEAITAAQSALTANRHAA